MPVYLCVLDMVGTSVSLVYKSLCKEPAFLVEQSMSLKRKGHLKIGRNYIYMLEFHT